MRVIKYHGIDIRVWEQSIAAGGGITLWLKRPVEDKDLEAIKAAIDAGRRSLARDLLELDNSRLALMKEVLE
jgi:hypothetical protein